MRGFPKPDCPTCRGSGEKEIWFTHPGGTTVAVDWQPCPCTFRPLVEELRAEEDWTKP